MEAGESNLAQTVESVNASRTEVGAEQSLAELLEQLGRQVSALALCETRLAAARREPELRRAAGTVAVALLAALAFLTAFALANTAALRALSPALSDWGAALVLAAAWTAVGAVVALWLRARASRVKRLTVQDAAEARHEAERAMQATIEQLRPAISREVALVAVPMAIHIASDLAAEAGDEIVETADEIIEGADDVVEALMEDVAGSGAVNQVWDVVLLPGRFCVRVASGVLKRDDA